jgi:hypothetical protein
VPIEEDEREKEVTPETLAQSRQTALANSSHSSLVIKALAFK